MFRAWRSGAQVLTYDERLLLANDPLNLQPTAGWANDDKQAADASRWLPPNEDYHCTYVARQIAVKATYDLWVTQAEHDTMVDILNGCV
ncbi:MAG: HNH endonuclease family protein [Pseudoclavibacter sp.]